MRVTLLGPVAAAAAGTALPLGGLKQRAVFALMALNAGRVVALDRLVDELWTDEPPSRATLSLQSYVARLRRVLADVSASDGETPRILTQPPGWLLTLDPGLVDVTRFEALIADARSAFLAGDPAAASRALQEALALYTGEPMADLTDVRFAREEADRLNELRLSATELLLQTQLALGESDAVAERAGRFVAANPFRERGWSAYMIALYRSGRQSEALGAAARLRRLLATELGVDPSAEVRRLEERILRQDPALLTPEVVRAAGPAATGSASSSPSSSGPSSSGPSSSGPSPSGPESSSPTRLVGRDGVLSAVDTVVAAAGAGRGRLVLLHAPAGLGKSSILAELETRVRDAGGTVLRGDCIGADAAPALWPWVSVVRGLAAGDADSARRALAGLQHGRIGPDGGDPTDPPVSRMQLFRAVIDALAAERALRPVAVVMDDVHWADADTTTLLSLAVDELAAHGVLFAVAVRSGEAGADRVLALVDRLRRADVHRVSLLPLGVREVGVLVGELSGADPPGEVISAIHDRTAGNPLFVRELVRLLASEQRLDAEGVSATLPGEVREVLRHRIARLPQQTVAVLTVIAVAGSPATVDLLAAVTGLDHDAVLDGCEAAELAGLLIDDSRHPGCFVLSHDLMRQTLEQSLSGARRLRLHARIAEALQTRRPMNAQEIVDVARHLTVAAPLVGPAAAVPYLIAASDDALSRYANDQAERHLRTALELIPQVRDPAERSALTGPVRARLSFLLLTVHGSGIKIEAGAGRDIARPTDPESTVGWLGAMFEAVTNGRAPMAAAAAEVVLAGDMLPMTRFCAHFVRGFASELTGRIALAGQDFEATEQLVADGVDVQVAGFFAGAVASAAQLALVSHMSGDEARADTMLATASGRAAGSERALAIVALHQTWLGAMRGDALTTRQHAAECRALATRLDFGMYGHAADLIGGWADAVAGDAGGAARADSAFDRYVAGEARMLVPMYLLLRAEAHAVSGATTLVHELIRQSRAVEAQVGEVCSSPRLLAWAASTLPVEA